MGDRPRILICGGRDYADRDTFNRTMALIANRTGCAPRSGSGIPR